MFLEEYDMELHYKTLREEGYEEGYEAGEKNGYEAGAKKFEQKMNALIQRLAADNRTEDLIRSASDTELQKRLFAEYGL